MFTLCNRILYILYNLLVIWAMIYETNEMQAFHLLSCQVIIATKIIIRSCLPAEYQYMSAIDVILAI